MVIKLPRTSTNTKKLVAAAIENPTVRTIQKISKTKKFVLGLMQGQSIAESKLRAGYSMTTPTAQIMKQPVARLVMKSLVEKEFHNTKYIGKLKQLWDAQDIRTTKRGDMYATPNWPAQVAAFDRVTDLRGLSEEADEDKQPQGITVQIVGEGNVSIKDMDIP